MAARQQTKSGTRLHFEHRRQTEEDRRMDQTRDGNATESLNQTLKRFQSMIKQVEQRFAERERYTEPKMNTDFNHEDQHLQRS